MPDDFQIIGDVDLKRLGKRIKDAGDKTLNRELSRSIKLAAERTKLDIKSKGYDKLPSGMRAWMGAGKVTLSVSNTKAGVRVRMIGKMPGHDWKRINAGRLRHPVFGKDAWVTQDVEPGFFSDTVKDDLPRLRRAVVKAIEDVARKVEG